VMAQSVTETTTITKSVTVNGTAGTQNVACRSLWIVYRLDQYGDNNLSVRYTPYGPRGPANKKDQLYHVCIVESAPCTG
jgi:hypothetical protein